MAMCSVRTSELGKLAIDTRVSEARANTIDVSKYA